MQNSGFMQSNDWELRMFEYHDNKAVDAHGRLQLMFVSE